MRLPIRAFSDLSNLCDCTCGGLLAIDFRSLRPRVFSTEFTLMARKSSPSANSPSESNATGPKAPSATGTTRPAVARSTQAVAAAHCGAKRAQAAAGQPATDARQVTESIKARTAERMHVRHKAPHTPAARRKGVPKSDKLPTVISIPEVDQLMAAVRKPVMRCFLWTV